MVMGNLRGKKGEQPGAFKLSRCLRGHLAQKISLWSLRNISGQEVPGD